MQLINVLWLAGVASAMPAVFVPYHKPVSPAITRRNYGSLNNQTCAWDPQTSDAWIYSGCNNMLQSWLDHEGQTDWLQNMDVKYHLEGGFTDLDCNDISSSNLCPAPDSSCQGWPNQPYYYIRALAANVVSVFETIHETLQDDTIVNLGSIGQMLTDFKTPVPDVSWLTRLLGNLSSGAGLFATIAGLAMDLGPAGPFLSIFAGVMFVVARYTLAPDAPDYDAIEASAQQYATDVFTNANTYLKNLLPAFWGAGNETMLDEVWDTMVQGGAATEPADGSTWSIHKILSSGDLMVPVEKSDIVNAVTQSIDNIQLSVLGNVLAALQYFVLGLQDLGADVCAMWYGAQYINNWCYIFLYLPVGSTTVADVPQEKIDKAQTWGLNMVDMYNNVAACNNQDQGDSVSQRASAAPFIPTDDNKYPPCFFGIAYVKGYYLNRPFIKPDNVPPSWIPTYDNDWNEALTNACKVRDYPACSYSTD